VAGLVRRIKRAWIALGLMATVVFTAWCLLAYRANADGVRASRSDERVTVTHEEGRWSFRPRTAPSSATGLLFFSGALVDPRAYARLARDAAADGHPAVVVELPWRGALGGAEGSPVLERGRAAMTALPEVRCWVVGGHSRGGEVASRFVLAHRQDSAALLLVATSHPRDIDLASLPLPVTKLVGDRDGLATPERVARNRHLLPPATRWVDIVGANHSQFGDYGFQPGDRFARISRQSQQRRLAEEARRLLAGTAALPACLSPLHPQ
jgi:pimeloyl-ACP methyl ester carboxylesterase